MILLDLIKRSFKKKAIREATLVYAGSLFNGASLLLLNIVLARTLSQDQYGIFALAVTALSVLAEMSDFGLNAGVLRFAPYYLATDQPQKLLHLLRLVWRWRVTMVIVLTILGVVGAHPAALYLYGQPVVAPYLAFAALGIGGVILLGFLATWLQAKQNFLYNATMQACKGGLRLAIVTVMWLFGFTNLYAYLSVYIFVPWLLFLVNFKKFPDGLLATKASTESEKSVRRQLSRYSFWLTLSSFAGIIGSRVDQAMISHYLGLAEVALFTAAWQFIQLLPIVYNSINSVLTPRISSLKTKVEVVFFLKRTLRWVSLVALAIGMLIYPSQYLITYFFGSSYAPAMPLYVLLAYGILLNVLVIPFSLTIIVFNQTRLMAYSSVVQALVNIGGNLLLIPTYGIMGAAYTFIISMVVLVLWNVILALYLLKNKELNIE